MRSEGQGSVIPPAPNAVAATPKVALEQAPEVAVVDTVQPEVETAPVVDNQEPAQEQEEENEQNPEKDGLIVGFLKFLMNLAKKFVGKVFEAADNFGKSVFGGGKDQKGNEGQDNEQEVEWQKNPMQEMRQEQAPQKDAAIVAPEVQAPAQETQTPTQEPAVQEAPQQEGASPNLEAAIMAEMDGELGQQNDAPEGQAPQETPQTEAPQNEEQQQAAARMESELAVQAEYQRAMEEYAAEQAAEEAKQQEGQEQSPDQPENEAEVNNEGQEMDPAAAMKAAMAEAAAEFNEQSPDGLAGADIGDMQEGERANAPTVGGEGQEGPAKGGGRE